MHSPGRSGFVSWSRFVPLRRQSPAFSLVELLTVMGFMSLLVAVTMPALNSLRGGGDFTRGVDEVALTLNRARTLAMTQNTYVWVGFYEESASASGGGELPPYSGRGQLVLGMVASVDGTRILEDGAAPAALPDDRLRPLGRLQKIARVHLTDVGAPAGTGGEDTFDGRPGAAYEGADAAAGRISSESAERTPFPFSLGNYTFHKTIRFSPTGEAVINGAPTPRRLGEIGLTPAQGDHVAAGQTNLAAIQFSGMGGNVRTYRR